MRLNLLPILSIVAMLAGCIGRSGPFHGRALDSGLCTEERSADPLDICFCYEVGSEDIRPYDDNGPPTYEPETYAPAGDRSLMSSETAAPSRGSAGPGPVLVR